MIDYLIDIFFSDPNPSPWILENPEPSPW